MYYVSGMSFYQMNQSWNTRVANESSSEDTITALNTRMATAMQNLYNGQATIAAQRAVDRINLEVKAAQAKNAKNGSSSSVNKFA